jgi:hypothetical protein
MGAIRIDRATDLDRRTIYGLRHRVYALELGQHAARPEAELTDSIDARNEYLTASVDDELAQLADAVLSSGFRQPPRG